MEHKHAQFTAATFHGLIVLSILWKGMVIKLREENELTLPWICDKCKKQLQLSKVKVCYLGGNFEVDLMKCPECGNVFIGEDLALGKMLEVEKGLEDK